MFSKDWMQKISYKPQKGWEVRQETLKTEHIVRLQQWNVHNQICVSVVGETGACETSFFSTLSIKDPPSKELEHYHKYITSDCFSKKKSHSMAACNLPSHSILQVSFSMLVLSNSLYILRVLSLNWTYSSKWLQKRKTGCQCLCVAATNCFSFLEKVD